MTLRQYSIPLHNGTCLADGGQCSSEARTYRNIVRKDCSTGAGSEEGLN